MPYKLGDKFSFSDGTSTIQLKVDEAYKSNAHTQRKGWAGYKMCTVEARARMTSNTFLPEIEYRSYFPYPAPNSDGDIDTVCVDYEMLFLSSNEWSGFVFEIRAGQVLNKIPLLNSYNNGYKEYFNVMKLEHDTLNISIGSISPIFQVYIAESVGIIQFKDRKNNKTWSFIGKE
jgi:hypothetical protein